MKTCTTNNVSVSVVFVATRQVAAYHGQAKVYNETEKLQQKC